MRLTRTHSHTHILINFVIVPNQIHFDQNNDTRNSIGIVNPTAMATKPLSQDSIGELVTKGSR